MSDKVFVYNNMYRSNGRIMAFEGIVDINSSRPRLLMCKCLERGFTEKGKFSVGFGYVSV